MTAGLTSSRVAAACASVALIVALGACGSSKPAYCGDLTSLQDSIKGLKNLDTSTGVVSGLQSQLTKIQSDASALVSSAKSDFPNETTAIKSSVDALSVTVKALPSSPSATDIATLTRQGGSVVTAVNSFTDATSSKCG